ncbi:alpha/beta hydrolase-fold protein [Aquimarina algicola]|uniref:Esterase n=1 Tax=Aquimarina algicola TaxID=2589995 RepID=A0A504JEF2_9FLAO|nr:alpha/beta hydrolase-fold protein [Aquimarina algicola]TPN86815.1 esterase [Aquimarina algicola]
MKLNLFIGFVLTGLSIFAQKNITIGHTSSIYSQILDEDRLLEIYLPKDYDTSTKNYPVLYLLDSFLNFRHAVASAEFLNFDNRIPEIIIVGIRNTHRVRDLTPESINLDPKQRERLGNVGGADNFIAFLEKELMPHIEKNYRTAPYKIISGHSLGGLFNVYSFLKHPELFNAYITISPSLWYPIDNINDGFDTIFPDPTKMKQAFYMTLATEIAGNMRGNIIKLGGDFENYINTNKNTSLRFKYHHMPEESHLSVGLPSVFFGLRYIFEPIIQFKRFKTKRAIMAQGGPKKAIENVLNHFDDASKTYGFEISNESALIDLGYDLLKIEDLKPYAVDVFKVNLKERPNSYDAYSLLGMAYENLGELQKAKDNYKIALDLVKKTGNFEWETYKADLDKIEKKIRVKTNKKH